VLFVVGVSDGRNEIVKPRDAPAILRRTGKPAIGADRILRTRINRKLFLQNDGLLPAVTEIIGVETGVPGFEPAQAVRLRLDAANGLKTNDEKLFLLDSAISPQIQSLCTTGCIAQPHRRHRKTEPNPKSRDAMPDRLLVACYKPLRGRQIVLRRFPNRSFTFIAARARYAEGMLRMRTSPSLFVLAMCLIAPGCAQAQAAASAWTFAVSGDSRNCGDFVMPAIAAKVKAERDVFYWHLGDFRAISSPDQDLQSMQPGASQLSKADYQQRAWDDFLEHQVASFGSLPVFLGRGNHENIKPMTREGYMAKFSSFLRRPEIEAQRKADGTAGDAVQPWYHWTRDGVDFITLDNASKDEFSDAQLRWLRSVLDRDLAAQSGIRTIVAAMHEALPHSTGSDHAMDDWELGIRSGELVYTWLFDAQAAGKHVYTLASHSHYYSPNIFNTPYWKQHSNNVVPGIIIGSAGAHRYQLPREADKASRTKIYGYLQGTVHSDGSIDFALHELSESDLVDSKWPNAPPDAIHECFVHNFGNDKE
jgi:hypothetical protein